MPILATILLLGLLLVGGSLAYAQPSAVQTQSLLLIVRASTLLKAPPPVTLTLQPAAVEATTNGRAALAETAGSSLSLTQNSGAHKIVVQATHAPDNAPNDTRMRLCVAHQSPVMLVNRAQDAGAQELCAGIHPGQFQESLTWALDGSVAGTPAGNYNWLVTFTDTAQE